MIETLHSETQKFNQKFLWILVLFAALLPLTIIIIGIVLQYYFQIDFSEEKTSAEMFLTAALIAIVFGAFIVYMFKSSKLIIEVKTDGFYYRFAPFHFKVKKIGVGEIQSFEIRKVNPMLEYGGWGIRHGFKRGKGYVAAGDSGVQFVMKDGRKVFFTSQQPKELEEAMKKVFKDNKNIERDNK